VVAVSTGLRPGEVCALTLKDIDFKESLIHVNKTLVYQTFEGDEKKTFHFDNPKTKSSKRDIPINQQCALVLDNTLDVSDATIHERFEKFQESDKEKDNIVYLSSVGT
jgi:integrase